MKKNKTNKIIVWVTTSALAMGFAIAALPAPMEELYPSAATTAEVVGTTFSDDFEKYTSYSTSGQEMGAMGGLRTSSAEGWTNQWFDGIGDGERDLLCTSDYASIVDDDGNNVLYLNTNKNDNSFFYLTPTVDGSPLVLKNYEISFKFKVRTSTKAEDRRTMGAPWFGTLNRKTITGDGTYDPADGRFNGTNNMLMALRSGVKPSDASTEPNYFYSFGQKNMGDSFSDFILLGEKESDGTRGELDNIVKPDTIYEVWHAYKCVVNEDSFDLYLDGKHMGGGELGTGSGYNCVREEGYISLALCVADIYVDDVNISEILPIPSVSGSSSATMREDKTQDTVFTLVNTKTIVSIKNGTSALAASAYALSSDGKSLTINKSYIDTLGVGNHTLSVTASDGTDTATFDISIVITETPGVAGGNNTVSVQLGNGGVITLVNVGSISSITKDGAAVATNVYTYASGSQALTFTAAYISTLGIGTHTFTVNTNNGEFTLTLKITEQAKLDGSSLIQVEKGSTASWTLLNVTEIVAVTYNDAAIPASSYTYSNGVITFTGEYTSSLATGRHAHVIKTDAGDLSVTIRIKDSSASTDTAVTNVIDLIDAIPTSVTTRNGYTSAQSTYDMAKSAYDALTATQQNNVTNANALTTAKEMLDAFKANMDAADAVDAKIAAIPTTVSTRENYATAKSAYDTAKSAYDGLATSAQSLVTKTAALTSAKNALDAFAAKIAAADDVVEKINAIPTSVSDVDSYNTAMDLYNTANNAYNNLDTDVQSLVTNADALNTAKQMLDEFGATLGEANVVMSKISAIPTSVTTRGGYNSALVAYNTAKDAYDALTPDQQANVTNSGTLATAKSMLDTFKAKMDKADEVDAKIALIPTSVTSRESYTSAKAAYDTAKAAYDGLDTIEQSLVTKATTLTSAKTMLDNFAAKIAAAESVDAKIALIPTSISNRDGYVDAKTKYSDAKSAYDNLAADVQALVTNTSGLTAAKSMLDAYEANLGAADAVMTKIDAIPTAITTRNGYISAQNAYTTAKAAYDGLDDDQKANVENADKLTTAKEMLDAFKAKMDKADEVDAKIALISTSITSRDEYTSTQAAYDTAKAAYDSLETDEQALVTKTTALTNAKTMLDSFKTDIDAADAVDTAIGALTTGTITAEDYETRKNAVAEAERQYNALSITAQELVTKYADLQARLAELNDYVSTLSGAEGVITMINSIPTSIATRNDYVTAKKAYDDAKEEYDALDETVQADVTNANTLTTAKAMLDAFAAKMVQADGVDAKIAVIVTTVETREDYAVTKAAYDTAKAAYDALQTDVQSLVTKTNTLTAVSATLTAFKANMDSADKLDATIAALPKTIESREDYAVGKAAYDTAKSQFDNANEDVLALVTNADMLTAVNATLTAYKAMIDAADEVDAKIAEIPATITTLGGYNAAKEVYNTAKTAYEGLSAEEKVLVTKAATLTSAKDMLDTFAVKLASANAIDALIEKIPTSEIQTREEFSLVKGKYDEAKRAYDNANSDVQSLVTKAETLTTSDTAIMAFAAKILEADAVDAQIETLPTSIGTREEYTSAKAAYDAVNEAYINSNVQSLIVNGNVLTAVNSALEIFAAKIEKADGVDALIAEIPEQITTRNGYNGALTAYNTAKDAYNALNAEEKTLVVNGAKIVLAKNVLDVFAAKVELADAADVFIAAIPETVSNKTEYVAAKKAYDTANLAYTNLDADVQSLVTKVATLTASKETLDTFATKIANADAVSALIESLATTVNSTAEKEALQSSYNTAKNAYDSLDAQESLMVENAAKLDVVLAAINGYTEPVVTPSIDGDAEVTVKYGEDAVFTLVNVSSLILNIDEDVVSAENYTYVNGKLTIQSAYIATLGKGVHSLYVTVIETADELDITINYQPATIEAGKNAAMFEKSTDGDVVFPIQDALSVNKLVREKTVNAECYAFADGNLTIKAAYLKSLSIGEHVFTVTTDNGSVSVSVLVSGEVTLQILIPEDSVAKFATDEDGIATFVEGNAEDVTFKFKSNSIPRNATITLKVGENVQLSSDAYSYTSSNNTLTIKAAYVQTLLAGTKTLTLVVTVPPVEEKHDEPVEVQGGCGSSIGIASTVLAAVVVGGLVMGRKKKED